MNSTTLMFAALLFPTLSLAAIPVGAAMPFGLHSLVQPPAMIMQDNPPEETCADFTGKWQGECTVDGQEQKMQMGFDMNQSGCKYIEAGVFLTVGGTTQFSITDKDWTLQQTMQIDWNKDRTELLGDWVTTVRMLSGPHANSSRVGRTLINIKLEGEKALLLDIKAHFTPGHTLPDGKTSNIACRLVRQ